jgi:hypothetical protein
VYALLGLQATLRSSAYAILNFYTLGGSHAILRLYVRSMRFARTHA